MTPSPSPIHSSGTPSSAPPDALATAAKLQGIDIATLGQAIAQSAEAIIITDTEQRIEYVNQAFERISGYSSAEVIGSTPKLLQSGKHDIAFYEQIKETLQKGQTWYGRFINRRKDGSCYQEEGSIAPVYDAQRRLVHYVAVKRDVSRELELEQQFLQSQKMEAVGRLAGSIAHDFNNLLTSITGFASMALSDIDESHSARRDLNQILNATRRAAELTKKLLAFSQRQVTQNRLLNLNESLMEMGHLLRSLLGTSVELILLPGDKLGPIKADPAQIAQVILNLAVNAKDAMAGGGKLTVSTANVDIPDASGEANGTHKTPWVRLTVADTGCGMSEEVKRHLFEPFFTTKEKGKGTGLGLATVYGIVMQSGGTITVTSEPGTGTQFEIYLPRLEGAPEAESPSGPGPSPERAAAGGNETILLVEDEQALRELSARILRQRRYNVLEAGNGEEALRMAGKHRGKIDLLFTDVMMPIMGGMELAVEMRVFRPDIKIVFTSGYTDDLFMSAPDLREGTSFLQKPFSPSTMLAKIREALDSLGAHSAHHGTP